MMEYCSGGKVHGKDGKVGKGVGPSYAAVNMNKIPNKWLILALRMPFLGIKKWF